MDMAVTGMAADAGQRGVITVGSVALTVRDLAGMEAFYRNVVGLYVLDRTDGRTSLGTSAGHVLLELLDRPDALPAQAESAGLFHTAFLLPSRGDLGRWLTDGAARRVPLDGAADHLVSEAVYLSDPEGNGVEVYADRPRAEWRWRGQPGARRVEMANNPLDTEGLVRAGAGTDWAGAPDGTRIGHVHLCVGDVAAAARFYGEVLGLDLTASWPGAAFMSTGGYHHHVAVNTWRSAGAGPRDMRQAGLAGVTFDGVDAASLAGIARRAGVSDIGRTGLCDPSGTPLRFQTAA